jgi:hypothetical protein
MQGKQRKEVLVSCTAPLARFFQGPSGIPLNDVHGQVVVRDACHAQERMQHPQRQADKHGCMASNLTSAATSKARDWLSVATHYQIPYVGMTQDSSASWHVSFLKTVSGKTEHGGIPELVAKKTNRVTTCRICM